MRTMIVFTAPRGGALLRQDIADSLNAVALTTDDRPSLETLCVAAVALGLTMLVEWETDVEVAKPR